MSWCTSGLRTPASRSPGLAIAPLLVLVAAGAQAPVVERITAARALDQARESGASEDAPRALEAAERAFAEARKRMRRGDFVGAAVRFEAAARRASMAERLVGRQQRLDQDRALRVLGRAENGLEELDWLATYLPPRSPIRADIKRAELSVAEARMLLARKAPRRSLAAARDAGRRIAEVHARFARHILGSADPGRRARYRKWVRDTIAWSRSHHSRAIIVDKMRRTLTLVSDGRRVHTYKAELGINGTLIKVVAGDRATPEGRYKVIEKRDRGQTRWHRALLLNYPNKEDLKRFRRARRRGRIPRRADPGSLIEIHGEGGRGGDWTDGCVALTNRDMDHLFSRVSVGTPVTIVGFEVDEAGPSARSGSARRGGGGATGASP